MATIQFSNTRDGAIVVTWAAMAGTDDGSPFRVPSSADLTFQVTGTFGGATCTLQGSNDGTNWNTLTAKSGTTGMAHTSAASSACNENPLFVRPLISGGSGSALAVVLAVFPKYAKTGY